MCKLEPECKGFTWAEPNYAVTNMIFNCALKSELKEGNEEIVGLWRGTKECGDCKYSNVAKTLSYLDHRGLRGKMISMRGLTQF